MILDLRGMVHEQCCLHIFCIGVFQTVFCAPQLPGASGGVWGIGGGAAGCRWSVCRGVAGMGGGAALPGGCDTGGQSAGCGACSYQGCTGGTYPLIKAETRHCGSSCLDEWAGTEAQGAVPEWEHQMTPSLQADSNERSATGIGVEVEKQVQDGSRVV